MKQKWLKFYDSKWFIPTIFISFIVVGTAIIYTLFERYSLWFGLLLVVGFVVVIRIITFILSGLIKLLR